MEMDCNKFIAMCLGKFTKTLIIMVYSLFENLLIASFLVFYKHFVYYI